MVEKWIKENALNPNYQKTNSMNFWNIVHDIQFRNTKEGRPLSQDPRQRMFELEE